MGAGRQQRPNLAADARVLEPVIEGRAALVRVAIRTRPEGLDEPVDVDFRLGRVAEAVLDRVQITTNKQIIPDDPNPPLRPSGIRMGTPAATTRGMLEPDMLQLSGWICECLRHPEDEDIG